MCVYCTVCVCVCECVRDLTFLPLFYSVSVLFAMKYDDFPLPTPLPPVRTIDMCTLMLEMFFAQLAVPTDVRGFISLSQLKPNPGTCFSWACNIGKLPLESCAKVFDMILKSNEGS